MLAVLALLLAPSSNVEKPIEPPPLRQLPDDTVHPSISDAPLPSGVTKRTIEGAWAVYERDHSTQALTGNGYGEALTLVCNTQCNIFLIGEPACEVGREYSVAMEVQDRTYPVQMLCEREEYGIGMLIAPATSLPDTIVNAKGIISFTIASADGRKFYPSFSLNGAAEAMRLVYDMDAKRRNAAAKPAPAAGR